MSLCIKPGRSPNYKYSNEIKKPATDVAGFLLSFLIGPADAVVIEELFCLFIFRKHIAQVEK